METIKKAAKVLSGDNEEGARTKGGLTSTEKTTPPKPGDTILLTGERVFALQSMFYLLLKGMLMRLYRRHWLCRGTHPPFTPKGRV